MRRLLLVAPGPDGDAALDWLGTLDGIAVRRVERLADASLPEADLVWAHGPAEPDGALATWLERGGRLLATLDAALLPHRLGVEPVAPDERREGVWRHQEDEFWLPEYRSFLAFPHIRGLAGFGPHPLFEGIDQGTMIWAPTEGEPYRWVAYRSARPERGAVVATERSFIHLNPERAVAWEHRVGDGGILSIGAFVHPASPDDLLRRQLHAVLRNAILGDAIPHRGRTAAAVVWPRPGPRDGGPVSVAVPALAGLDGEWLPSDSRIAITSPAAADDPWTLAGRRLLAVGGERSGLREVWAHPVRLMRDVTLRVGGRVPEAWSMRVSPDELVRQSRVDARELTERWTAALEQPVLVWELEAAGLGVAVEWTTDLRRMWPYPAGTYGALGWSRAEDGGRLWIGAAGGPVQALFQAIGGRLEVAEQVAGPGLRVRVAAGDRLRLVVIGATDTDDLQRTIAAVERRGMVGLRRQRMQHAARLGAHGTAIETPEPIVDRAFEWAKVRTDAFLAETPGVGRSLMAGYAASRPGWGDGRPGYAWYFGRDACWTAFAQLAAGEREGPRDVIAFLSRTQDVSGKVCHEYTTSGLVHYDAADSTPLYLLLVGRYAAWTGDLDFLRRHWGAIAAGYRFCLETDRDGDGLIENHRVGHGWIEHGPLGGAYVTLYLAACWVAALEALAPVAARLAGPALAEELAERAGRARAAIARRFRVDGEYALGILADGSPQRHRTAMLAVPLLLGAVPPDEAASWYDAVAGAGFSAPWGVRMIARDDPLFLPTGYHRGAVWPLYTGWVSLAEWRGGRYEAALEHLRANARLVESRAKGAFDEVLHGLEETGGGVCPDQAWSAAMVLAPVIEGLWGVIPDALGGAVRIRPYLPARWERMALRRLRVGPTSLDVVVRRRPGGMVVRVRRRHGPGIRVELEPRALPAGAVATVDDVELGAARAVFEARAEHEASFTW
ncbi:MAG TPA: GH116 family glycosyl hydrolase [Gemmatimonadales bacterium]|nr:GH116 family glycosyl hydrolase [Gemmatimonadales bacterium]